MEASGILPQDIWKDVFPVAILQKVVDAPLDSFYGDIVDEKPKGSKKKVYDESSFSSDES